MLWSRAMVAPEPPPPPRGASRRDLIVLLVAALAVYTANPFGIGLRAVDDCYYARKGVEMARSGGFFTVTWNGSPDFLYPPLQFWLLGRSFAWFGENDLAARLPSIAQAIGTLAVTYRIGMLTVGGGAAAGAVALLAVSPYFADNARGCMIEMALAFWVSLVFMVALEGLRRPRAHLLLALPLGAAILTKSILGLLPLPVLGVAAVLSAELRATLRRPWPWLGVLLGLGLGASWPVDQWLRFGPAALRAHYLDNIAALAARPLGLGQRLIRYPVFLLERFQPVILPALAGAVPAWRRWRRDRDSGSLLLILWVAVPLVLFNLSGTQERRYLFPLFPPLALLAADAFERWRPGVALVFRRWLAPVALGFTALLFWIWTPGFINQADPAFAASRAELQRRIPPGEPLTYLGSERGYWPAANPLLYYADRMLERPSASADTAIARASARRSRLILADRVAIEDLHARLGRLQYVTTGIDWVVVEVP
ncbi:MAG TPA: glycosyltransferase family 39 protein [Candidatus Eisenbacteria bacterium]|nr:glycosyltransferase family 39 protein [Candidatus Eisenbacteria bacterium]